MNALASPIPHISTGTGILLASFIIALVLLYAQTKDRWNWGAIWSGPKWIFGLLVAGTLSLRRSMSEWGLKHWAIFAGAAIIFILGALLVFQIIPVGKQINSSSAGNDKKAERIDASTLKTRAGVRLGMPQKEVILRYGIPESNSDWKGNELDTNTSDKSRLRLSFHKERPVHAYILDGVVVALERLSVDISDNLWERLGKNELGEPKTIEGLLEKFGEPTKTIDSANGVCRTYYFDDFSMFFEFCAGSIREVGIYKVGDFP